MARRRLRERDRLAVALVAVAVLLVSYLELVTWSDRTAILVSFLAFLVALVVLVDSLVSIAAPPVSRFIRSVATSVGRGVAADAQVRRLTARFPRTSRWIARRFSRERWDGLYLTVTLALAAYFLAGFAAVLRALVFAGRLVSYDAGIAALLRAFRTPTVTRVLWIATVGGDPRVGLALCAVFVGLLLLWGRRGEAVLVGVTLALGSWFGDVVKVATARHRPPAAFALIRTPSSASFPSGHALSSLLFFALLAFVLVREWGTTGRRRAAIVLGAAFGALMVAISRVYLGVHWPTDVIASWFLASSWATLTIGGFLIWERYAPGRKRWRPALPPRVRIPLTALAVGLSVAAVVVGAQADPLLKRLVAAEPKHGFTSAESSAFVRALPRFTEKLDGTPAEPVSIVFVGSRERLVAGFGRAGWHVADPVTPLTVLHIVVASVSNRPYATAPVTPAFIGGTPDAIAFEKSQGPATARRRHHARFWATSVELDGEPVWVGTASFDEGLEIGKLIPVPTHHIAPDVDAERRLVVAALVRTHMAREALTYRVASPEQGTDAEGDTFFTDGRAVVLVSSAR